MPSPLFGSGPEVRGQTTKTEREIRLEKAIETAIRDLRTMSYTALTPNPTIYMLAEALSDAGEVKW
jgi:hypothetical protein